MIIHRVLPQRTDSPDLGLLYLWLPCDVGGACEQELGHPSFEFCAYLPRTIFLVTGVIYDGILQVPC